MAYSVDCGMELLVHSYTSTVAQLKFAYDYIEKKQKNS